MTEACPTCGQPIPTTPRLRLDIEVVARDRRWLADALRSMAGQVAMAGTHAIGRSQDHDGGFLQRHEWTLTELNENGAETDA